MMQVYVYDGVSRSRLSFTKNSDSLLTVKDYPCLSSDVYIKATDDKVFYQYEDKPGVLTSGVELGGLHFYITDGTYTYYPTKGRQRLILGPRPGSDFRLENSAIEILFERVGEDWQLDILTGPVFVNNHLTKGKVSLPYGAEVAFGESSLKFFPEEVWANLPQLSTTTLKTLEKSNYQFYPDYPDYHRSPRLIYRSSEEKVQVNAPSAEPQKPRNEILKMIIPPIVMVGVTLIICIFQPRGLYIIMSVVSSLMTTIFSIQNYFKSKRDYKENLANRINSYHAYLSDKSIQLTELATKQRQGQLYHFPGPKEVVSLAKNYSHRIYEKTPQQFDFLFYRLGLGKVPTSYHLTYSQAERSGVKDPLEVEGYTLYDSHRHLDDMPIVANLMHGPVGYVGDRDLVLEQLQLMVQQIALFHSYHEVQFVTIMPEEERGLWHWMRWLPHATLQGMNVRGFVYNQRSRDQVLNSLNQILKQRQTEAMEPGRKELLFSPHYVVLVTDKTLIMDHVIMEFFNENPMELGCSLVFVEDVMSSLSENIQTVVTLKDRQTGQLVMEEGVLREIDFSLDHFPEGYDKEELSRQLAPLNHLQNLKSSIPESVTFMEMYGVAEVHDLNVVSRWASHAPYKSLAVPLGLRGQDDIVQLNLHEKAHGPHGLVAGTTGSGKSEIIQSYILSLAVNFHPHDVAFLLIDYKGGGMANLFRDLPHLLGTITNLDGAQSMRALTSIKAELKRRQRLFSEYDVNHINQYQKKYKLGEVPDPMPHLFLISDEFAELKQNQPDFMAELVSTARIGRSLGIHLILATQKPSGVVNDQIWSNSRFKLALKVADRADSQEMLRTPDAADITQSGRAYLQVGNNEVYELFQSAWSGAEYQPEKDKQGIEDHTIYAINDLGQYEILNDDLSGLEETEDIRQVPTELDAIVGYIHDLVVEEGIPALPQPWLPPLKERIALSELTEVDYKKLWTENNPNLVATLGLVDIPSQQAQKPLVHDFTEDGNIVLFSSPTMGKSTFLQTIAMDLATRYTPENIHCYLLDFGTNGLMPLRQLPHVSDHLSLDETEKLSKFIGILKKEIESRKSLFRKYSVANAAMYEEVTQTRLTHLFILVDSYDGIRESAFKEDLDALFLTLSRDGISLGIHLVLTASRLSAIPLALLTNIKRRISLKMSDDNDSRTIIGRTAYKIEDLPGRGLVNIDEPEIFQVALPVEGVNDYQQNQNLTNIVSDMSTSWTGPRPKGIPIVPETLSLEDFKSNTSVQETVARHLFPIGLDVIDVEAISIPLQSILYMSNSVEALSSLTTHLLSVACHILPYDVMLIDPMGEYPNFESHVDTYIDDTAVVSDMGRHLLSEIESREGTGNRQPWFVFIPDFESFLNLTKITATDWNIIYSKAAKLGVYLIIGGSYQLIGIKVDDILKTLRLKAPLMLFAMKISEQHLLDKTYNSKEPMPPIDEIYVHNRKTYCKVKITK